MCVEAVHVPKAAVVCVMVMRRAMRSVARGSCRTQEQREISRRFFIPARLLSRIYPEYHIPN